jgi:hypothetical protein
MQLAARTSPPFSTRARRRPTRDLQLRPPGSATCSSTRPGFATYSSAPPALALGTRDLPSPDYSASTMRAPSAGLLHLQLHCAAAVELPSASPPPLAGLLCLHGTGAVRRTPAPPAPLRRCRRIKQLLHDRMTQLTKGKACATQHKVNPGWSRHRINKASRTLIIGPFNLMQSNNK